MLVKRNKHISSIGQVSNSHNLTAGMHRKLRHTSIDHTDACLGADGWSNRTSTGTIVADCKLANWNIRDASQFPDDKAGDAISGVSESNTIVKERNADTVRECVKKEKSGIASITTKCTANIPLVGIRLDNKTSI